MRIVVSGGGTAGHVSPVLATVDALQQLDKDLEALYVGQSTGIEAELLRATDIGFASIQAGKLRRLPHAGLWANLRDARSLLLNARDMGRVAVGVLQSVRILWRFRPDVVFAKGGFVALPVALAARILRIPYVAHESDVVPGLGTKIAAGGAAAVATGFPTELYSLKTKRLVFTGNPVRPEMLAGDKKRAQKVFTLSDKRPVTLVVGGSQGATRINTAIQQNLQELLEISQIIHVAGPTSATRMRQRAEAIGITGDEGYHVEAFLPVDQMADAYAAADLVVARAGANTIAELAALSKAVIVLPNREAAAHQIINAERLEEAKAAVVVADTEPQALYEAICELIASEERRSELGSALAAFNVTDAPERLARLLKEVAGQRP